MLADLSAYTAVFAKSAAMLGAAEEHTALSRALSQLAETEEKIEQLQREQSEKDFYVMAELLKDYIALIGSVKVHLSHTASDMKPVLRSKIPISYHILCLTTC